ncbi:MBL fold metallo-hydrolase, partial [Candidatus Nomurabacteria bacterium]|nr:MBL fold metallo-hydrolase [Candidatus Nomurabacteria bacterium]
MRWFVLTLLIYSIVLTDTVDPVDSGITFLNVGVGDATIVRVDEKVIFIDAGPSDSILYNIDNLPKKIDLLVITHQHEDHISGARYLLERFDVREVIMPRLCDVDPIDVLYPSGAETRKTAITLLDNNDLIEYQYPL